MISVTADSYLPTAAKKEIQPIGMFENCRQKSGVMSHFEFEVTTIFLNFILNLNFISECLKIAEVPPVGLVAKKCQ